MEKLSLRVFLFLIALINFSYAQENSSGRVLYDVFEGNYSNEVESYPNPFRLGANGLNDDDFSPRSIILEFNKNRSHSRLTEESENTENRWSKFKNSSLELLGETFYDSHSKVLLNERNEFGENHIITSHSDSLKWTLTNDKKEILGYTCNKATSKRNYTNVSGKSFSNSFVVWYTLEIPVPFGPYYHLGLPGLVLEVQKTEGHTKFDYVASYIDLNLKQTIEISNPKEGIIIDEKAYEEKLNNYIKENFGRQK